LRARCGGWFLLLVERGGLGLRALLLLVLRAFFFAAAVWSFALAALAFALCRRALLARLCPCALLRRAFLAACRGLALDAFSLRLLLPRAGLAPVPRRPRLQACFRGRQRAAGSGKSAVGLRCVDCAGSHLQHHLLVVAQIHRRQLGILLPPLGDVRLVALVALQEMVFAKVSQNVGALLGHQHAGILGIGQVDLGDLLGEMLVVGVQLRHQALVDRHARLARAAAGRRDRCR
jgi:hypothetical protein